MEHRLGRTVRVFLVALAAMGLYRLAVVPWVEPRLGMAGSPLEMTAAEAAAIRARAEQRLAVLGDVFPPGAWERDDPIVLESRQMRLLFKDYHTLPDGRVNLVPCTVAMLPDRSRGPEGGGRTLVLRAPQGAVLEFDEPLDLQRGRLARLVGGSLRGQVTIRGTASAAGAEDDIEIVTRDIALDAMEVRTVETVQFRYGRSSGSGRGLLARLTPSGDAAAHGPNIGGVDVITLERDVRMRIEGVGGDLLPGRETADAGEPAAPVLVSCRGSLSYNVSANVVTLEDHVDVTRANADGATDRLACDLLAIVLDRAAATGAEASTALQGGLEPVEIQAKGAPVVVSSTAAGLEARAARLGYEIATRRILLDGDEPVSLAVQGSEMEARKIDYCPGPPGDPGALLAVGPGWFRTRPERGGPMQARWQQWLRMRPDGAGHVVSLAGGAEVAVEGQGRLGAGEMHLWLEVLKDAAAARAGVSPAAPPPAAVGPDLSRIRPARMLARGTVDAAAGAFTARTERLEVWFRAVADAGTDAGLAAGRGPAAPITAGAATPAGAEPRGDGTRFTATAGLVRGLVHMAPSGSRLEELSMEGQVRLVEQPADVAGGPPPANDGTSGLEILGDQMQLSRAARFDARAVVSGRPARVRGRGLDLEGPLVEFDRGRGRLLVDGAGRLRLPPMASGGLGTLGFSTATVEPQAAAPATPVDVTWQGRMDFDGLTARFSDRVEAVGGDAALRAGLLDVIFDHPFELAQGPRRGGPQPQVARVACGQGVRVENESTSVDGQRSRERLYARDLVIDRVSGDITGTGPGRLTSTRYGEAPQFTVGAAGPAPPAPTPAAKPPGLTYLGVDFQRGLRGNIQRRSLEFHQRVEAIWGPVATWDDALDPHAPGGPPASAVVVSCDALGVGQSMAAAAAGRPALELAAGGNVLVEGQSFTARSARLTWSEAKDLLVFEGDGRSDARLFRQLRPGAQPSSASAGKILYWRALERVEVEDARYLDLDQLRGGPATGLPGGRPPPPRTAPGGLPAT
jgi:hypothetical protein